MESPTMLPMIKRMRMSGRPQHRTHSVESEELQRKLEELELRFDEYNHRMKNSTQMMLGVLAMVGRGTTNQEVRSALDAVASKLKAIAQIQSILQRAGHVPSLRCDDLLRELCRSIQAASPHKFALALDIDPMELPSSTAVPLGLILTELLTNSIKHGLGPHHGCVRVSLKTLGETVELRVEDNGPGIQPSTTARCQCGLTLVRHLSSQLHGQFHMIPGPGGRGVLRFRRLN
jgi:two-component sensor histidine kinase